MAMNMDNLDIEGILSNNYNKYPHHAYIGNQEFLIQVPSEINEDTTYCLAGRGSGGLSDINPLLYTTDGQNVIMVAPVHTAVSDYTGGIDVINSLADQIEEQTGIRTNTSNSTFTGCSAEGPVVTAATVDYLKQEHAEGRDTRATVILMDSKSPTPIFNQVKSEDVDELDDSLIVAVAQSWYIDDSNGDVKVVSGTRLDAYDDNLIEAAHNGANVIIAAYDIPGAGEYKDHHVESVSITAALNLQKGVDSKLLDGQFTYIDVNGSIQSCEGMNYYYYDLTDEKWVEFPDLESAQNYVDYATGKVELYNTGFLRKADGTYVIGDQEVSSDELERMILSYKESGDESLSLEEYISKNLGGNWGTDAAEFNYRDTLAAVETLRASLDSIGGHVNSLGSINGLGIKTNPHSSFLSDMNAYPSGINTQGFQNAQDCLGKMCAQVENAYNVAVGVHTALLHAEDMAPTYYKSNTYADKASQTTTEPFAEDVTYVK